MPQFFGGGIIGNLRFTLSAVGCKVNAYDAQAAIESLVDGGFVYGGKTGNADICVVNTCAVTDVASKKSVAALRRAKKNSPNALIVAFGCLAQTAYEKLQAEADVVISAADKQKIAEIIKARVNKSRGVVSATAVNSAVPKKARISYFDSRTRAYVKIQDGCSNFCAYCVVPAARGASRSRVFSDCVAECGRLAQNGYKEIVITGVNIALYGKDLNDGGKAGATLFSVIAEIQNIDAIKRVRFGSIDPTLITDDFLREINTCSKVCPHFHLSLQSGCNKTLAAMNRSYDTAFYADAVSKIRRYYPFASITTDIIAGFPAETPSDFEQSLAFCEKIKFAKIHVFPFSPKRGTKAFDISPQVSSQEKRERTAAFLKLSEKSRNVFLALNTGRTLPVLVEKQLNGVFAGYSDNYIRVTGCNSATRVNDIVNITVTRNMLS